MRVSFPEDQKMTKREEVRGPFRPGRHGAQGQNRSARRAAAVIAEEKRASLGLAANRGKFLRQQPVEPGDAAPQPGGLDLVVFRFRVKTEEGMTAAEHGHLLAPRALGADDFFHAVKKRKCRTAGCVAETLPQLVKLENAQATLELKADGPRHGDFPRAIAGGSARTKGPGQE